MSMRKKFEARASRDVLVVQLFLLCFALFDLLLCFCGLLLPSTTAGLFPFTTQ